MSGLWKCPVTKYVEYDEIKDSELTIEDMNRHCVSDDEIQWAKDWLYGNRSLPVPYVLDGPYGVLHRVEILTKMARSILNESVI